MYFERERDMSYDRTRKRLVILIVVAISFVCCASGPFPAGLLPMTLSCSLHPAPTLTVNGKS